MSEVSWERFPHIERYNYARDWLQLQANLCANNTVEAYGRSLDDYLSFCMQNHLLPEKVTREDVASYVHDLASRPRPRRKNMPTLQPGAGLANATMHLRLTATRLFYDFLIDKGVRIDNPVGRGQYTPGHAFAGQRDRALIPHYHKLPWIPSDEQWRTFLGAAREESLRNRTMILLAYEGALRREELLLLATGDIDPAHRQLHIRAETTKNRRSRVVFYSEITETLLMAYLNHRRQVSTRRGQIFLSESYRNPGQPLSTVMWSKIVEQVARRADLPQFTTHTFRHLRLTNLARANLDIHEIATYAGHQSVQSTLLYIHLSGRDLSDKVARGMAEIDLLLKEVFS